MPHPPPPDNADLEKMAREAFGTMPKEFQDLCQDVVIRIQDFPDAETRNAMNLESPYDLLGLYHGVALPFQSPVSPAPFPEMIFLYRMPLLAYCQETGEELSDLVRHVLIHEIGHHFGFSDDDMEAIDQSDD